MLFIIHHSSIENGCCCERNPIRFTKTLQLLLIFFSSFDGHSPYITVFLFFVLVNWNRTELVSLFRLSVYWQRCLGRSVCVISHMHTMHSFSGFFFRYFMKLTVCELKACSNYSWETKKARSWDPYENKLSCVVQLCIERSL